MSVHYGPFNPGITTSSLILNLDAGNTISYPGYGTSWNDLSGNNNHFTVVDAGASGPWKPGGWMDFNGSYGCAKKINSDLIVSGDVTVVCWTRIKNSTGEWRTLLRGNSSGGDHHVIIQSGGWQIGMYDNTNVTGFNDSGLSQQSLPGYGTTQWNMLVWRWNNSVTPYYNLSYNDTPGIIRGSNSSINTRFKHGFCSIGAYNNGDQNNPANMSQAWGDIAKICIYSRYLTDSEIKRNFQTDRVRFGL
jgi:hypothetical protein